MRQTQHRRDGRRYWWWATPEALDSWNCIDPDFDEDTVSDAMIAHEIATTGAVALHPNADRLDFDPVPLHTHDAPGQSELERRRLNDPAYLAMVVQRQWDAGQEAERAAERAEERREKHNKELMDSWILRQSEFSKRAIEEAKRKDRALAEREFHLAAHNDELKGWKENVSGAYARQVLDMMRTSDPLARGTGRAWNGYAMVNEFDIGLCSERWPEVWRKGGLVIFKMV